MDSSLPSSAFCFLPPAYCPALPTCCFPPSGFCLLLSAYCLLLSGFCFPPSAFCFLPSAYCFLPTAFCLLLSAFCFSWRQNPFQAVEVGAERFWNSDGAVGHLVIFDDREPGSADGQPAAV